ncbi:MAG: dihydrodipicolinate synthase family protein [Lentisphaeria bacterium]|nr:dihydrodipicolinate synthase family protein [Lentisphaeria bacterium]
MSKIHFRGIMPALITPLTADGKVNAAAVKALMDDNYAKGVTGFYVTGGTGEGPLLSAAQRKAMVEAAIEANAGRGKIIVHTGSINADEAMDLTVHADRAGADGISSVPPSFYFRYTLEETVDYYKKLASNTSRPVIVYANPQSATGVDVNAVLEQLLPIGNICGVKDTRANYYLLWQLKQLAGGDINVINGPDESLLCGLMMGADGGIGSTYGLMPEKYVKLYKHFCAGELEEARAMQSRINKIISVLLGYARPTVITPVKEALMLCGFAAGDALYPASPFTAETRAMFKKDMEKAGFVFPA